MASSPPPPLSPSKLPPPGPPSRSPPPPEWPCARCTLRNPLSAAACAACDAVRPVDVDGASLGLSAVVASSSSRPLPPAQWSCARCTLVNPGSSAACAVCGAARPVVVDDGDELDFSAVAGASFLPLRRDPRNIGRSDAAMKSARAPSPDAVCERAGSNERDKTAAEKVNSETHLDKKTIKVMTYNVWFREDLELTKRMYALGNLIQHHNPDLICFQEVTPNIYMLLQKSGWWQEYKCSLSARMAMQRQYYCMQMSKLPVSSFECIPFSNSVMERELCVADINIGGATKLVLATSHLESPCAWNQMYSKERVTQANASMRILDKFRNVIFCGDMNWDDKGDGPFPLSDGWLDAWAELKPGEDGWTYDTRANGMLAGNRKLQKRLDRFVCKLPDFEIDTIEMIGKEAIPGISHYKEKTVRKVVQNIEYPVLPSDHFGLVLSITYASSG
uniref:RanBP2-type domain-containing protein n=1 Tax=Triticum aestivum TaxID=4565 RepID=A0A3B6QCA7_WHEAT